MRLPTYEEIARDDEQLEVYETPLDESLFAAGPPGSGKTVLAVHRAQMLASANIPVVLITYNRMLRRLIAQLTEEQMQAQTMHRFVRASYRARAKAVAPNSAPYLFDWDAMFATLERRGVTPSSIHAVVDEAQDLPTGFFRYLREFVATNISAFADEDQALTDERSTLREIKEAAGLEDPVLLYANHRNTPEVARVANFFHAGDVPVPEVMRPSSGELPQVVLYRNDGAKNRISNWFRARGGHVGVAVVNNETGETLYSELREQLDEQRVDFYSNDRGKR